VQCSDMISIYLRIVQTPVQQTDIFLMLQNALLVTATVL